jgi:hypothetical protein
MIERILRWPIVVGILMATFGCDNVSWGGFDLRLRGPGADSVTTVEDPAHAEVPDSALSLGPLVYAGFRSGNRAEVVPVAEITALGLAAIPDGPEGDELNRRILQARLRPGAELTVFHQGARVGAFVVEDTTVVSGDFCRPRPQALGRLLLVPEAAGVQQFLALERARGVRYRFGSFTDLSSVYDQRVASLNLAAEAVPLVGAPWPPSLLDIRQDLQILDLPGTEAPAVMATFLHQDQLAIGRPPPQAYALMVLGEPEGPRFRLTYTWYRPVATEGKGAPRYFSRLDWDGDGSDEILLEVLGSDSRWFAAIDRGPSGWSTTYQDPCGAPGAQGGGG